MTDPDDDLARRWDAWCRRQDDIDDAMAECLAEARKEGLT